MDKADEGADEDDEVDVIELDEEMRKALRLGATGSREDDDDDDDDDIDVDAIPRPCSVSCELLACVDEGSRRSVIETRKMEGRGNEVKEREKEHRILAQDQVERQGE